MFAFKKPMFGYITKLLLLTAISLNSFVCMGDSTSETIDNLLLQWQQIEMQRSQLKEGWSIREKILQQQLQLLNDEKSALNQLLKEKNSAQDDANTERQQLLTQQSSLEAQEQDTRNALQKAKSQIMAMFAQLPPVLKDSWQPHIDYLSLSTTTSSETLNHVVEALKKLDAFNNRIVLHQTIMDLGKADKTAQPQVQVQQIYLGAARAWYISKDKKYWGKGQPSIDGWQWTALNNDKEALPDTLLRLVTSLEQPSKAEWISLPLNIHSSATSNEELTQ